jgi:type I restriction enzyme R subunit
MPYNEQETRFWLIDPILRSKGYADDHRWLKLETKAPVEASGPKGRRRQGGGRTDYLLCVQVGDMPRPLPVAVLEAKKENEDPLKGMQQAKGYADCKRFDVKYAFASNGHLYGEHDFVSGLQGGPIALNLFLTQAQLTARYAKDTGVDLSRPDAAMLFQADSPAWSDSRYYQDAAIRAAFEKILRDRQQGQPPRVLLTLATGAGKTVIATNLLWRLNQAGQLPKPALFLCDREELRGQAYAKLKAAFGDNARIVKTEKGQNAAQNARIHIATYQTLGLDEDEQDEVDGAKTGFASFLSEHYGDDAFSVIVIDECHRSAWGRWSEVLKRNPNAIHIGLTATPRKLHESKNATAEDVEITAHNVKYFGEPVYEYTLIQAQEDGYLAACEIVKRKASIDKAVFTKEEILKAGVRDLKTGKALTPEDLTKNEYTGKDFDNELFIELRTPKMCEDLFKLLCENGGPEQKVIVFCNRELHADRVAQHMNNLYAHWCQAKGQPRKDHYAFKCMGGPNNGADLIEDMRGSGQRAFVACTVDLLEAGVDIERLNAVVFFRYLQSPIKFYQMVGRGTRIHEETQKYKFWLYDYTDVTQLFGTDFITQPPRPGGGKKDDGGDTGGGDGGDEEWEGPKVGEMGGQFVAVHGEGNFILGRRDGKEAPIPVEEYRREVIQRVLAEAHNLDDFRALWIEKQRRRKLIDHLLGDHFSPEVIRDFDKMTDFDLYDFLGHHGYHARALKRAARGELFVKQNQHWLDGMDSQAAIVIKGLGQQFAQGGTEALETPTLWEVPEIKLAGGLDALRVLGKPTQVVHEAKGRLFRV